MAHKCMIDGTSYSVTGGNACIDGTSRKIVNGKTIIDGSIYGINFKPAPKLSEVLADMTLINIAGRSSTSNSTTLPSLTFEWGDYVILMFAGRMNIMHLKGKGAANRETVFIANGNIPTLTVNDTPSIKVENDLAGNVYGATLMSVRFPNYTDDEVYNAFSRASVVTSAGRNEKTTATVGIKMSAISAGDFIFVSYNKYRAIDVWDGSSVAIHNSLGEATPRTHLFLTTNGDLKVAATASASNVCAATIIAIKEK